MKEIQAPHCYDDLNGTRIFLAGSIEMGRAKMWQAEVVAALSDVQDIVILNPRRNDWDSSWRQSMDHPQFRQQVEWELKGLDDADIIAMYFDPQTQSPVTLLELGIQAAKAAEKLVVCCPEGFWRKGNVDIVCAKYHVAAAEDIAGMLAAIRHKVANKKMPPV